LVQVNIFLLNLQIYLTDILPAGTSPQKIKQMQKKAPFFLGKNSASAIQTLKVRPCVIHISVVVAVFAAVMSAESFAHPIPKSIPHTECFFSYTIKLAHSANNYPDYSHRLKCTIKPE